MRMQICHRHSKGNHPERVINLFSLTIVLEAAEDVVGPSEAIQHGFDPTRHVHLDVIVLLQACKGEDTTSDQLCHNYYQLRVNIKN